MECGVRLRENVQGRTVPARPAKEKPPHVVRGLKFQR